MSRDSKINSNEDCSNKNSFEILGMINEEVMDRMEEDIKGDKNGVFQDGDKVVSNDDVAGKIKNKQEPSKFIGKGNKGNGNNKLKDNMKNQGSSKSNVGNSQALEEDDAKKSAGFQ